MSRVIPDFLNGNVSEICVANGLSHQQTDLMWGLRTGMLALSILIKYCWGGSLEL